MKSLKPYQQKRNFSFTKEPSGENFQKDKPSSRKSAQKTEKASNKKLVFVVQHHLARKDHFDFRLEWAGVLVSFAVPKGPSFNPRDKRLAVHVEDHPLDYASFEGTIPKGQYGGGTVMLWDEGTYEQLNNFSKGLKEGSLKFLLHGKRLCGKWALVRLKEQDQDNWLLFKEKDEFSKNKAGISSFVTSVKTGRSFQEIENQEDLTKRKNPFQSVNVKLCKLVEKVPNCEDYVFEIKYDGFRMLSFSQSGKTKLLSRNQVDFTQKFAEISHEITTLSNGRAFVFDGEIVALDEDGKPDFQALQNHLKFGLDAQIVFMIFDLLALDGKDLRAETLVERKAKLEALLQNFSSNILKFCQHYEGDGQKFFDAAKNMQLEGIVCKNKLSKYNEARDENWLKCKCRRSQEFVICGFMQSEKKALSAILLGAFQEGKLQYMGKCGTGFDEKTSKNLLNLFKKLIVKNCPFQQKDLKPSSNIFWLKSKLIAEIQFAEITKDGLLRQASFKGLREDKSAHEVALELTEKEKLSQEIHQTSQKAEKEKKKTEKSLKKNKVNENGENQFQNDFCGIEISNPEKLIFKDCKISKLEVAKYYFQVSQRMLDFVSGRVLSVVRCHGNMKECFFKKHPSAEKFAKRVCLQKEAEEYFFINSQKALFEQVQLGTIEFHVWGSCVKTLEKPDYMVFDLDPDENLSLEEVRQGVRDLKKIMDSLSLKSFLKTSGGKGYHIVVPFTPSADWNVFHDFAENVAHLMESKWPERYTTNIRKENRKGKVFIDFMRNTRGATSVAPYSLRARKGAKVSMPIFWAELNRIAPDGVDMALAIARLKRKDPWQDFYKVKQKLGQAHKNNKISGASE